MIRPYGDKTDDGQMQLSFTLPMPSGPRAKEAAVRLLKQLGFFEVAIATMEPVAKEYTWFVAYGRTEAGVDPATIDVPEQKVERRSFDEINTLVPKELGRRLVILGACTGFDAHTVGIDAIMNPKGFDGDYGLERYPAFDARNLGAQVDNAALVEIALRERADAVLLSQVITQRDIHVVNARDFVEKARARGLDRQALLLLGGPRLDHKTALELGFHAGFGPGTRPSDVANWLVDAMLARKRAAGVA